ncbi:MAG TPA: preprotein translocase subunit SecE [bacterium]|nr:preprotein translocase subunit SecE [bacterium]HOL49442.1 preprotein translocase subunit SecE [bacterium]HPO52612.1 preprotein translocase subunit SecE [bacterium]
MQKIKMFLKESQVEFKKVTWPNFQVLKRSTFAVIVLMILMAIYFGIIDVIFSRMLHVFAR